MRKTRFYLNTEKEVKWLNEMAANGWNFTNYKLFVYSFEKCEPGEYEYQIDTSDKFGKCSEKYRYFMEEAGLSAHNALSDIKATYSVFIAQQNIQSYGPEKMYGEDNVIKDMEFCGELKPCVSIGKYRGVSLEWISEHDQNYIRWCVSDKCNFMQSTKNFIKKYLK